MSVPYHIWLKRNIQTSRSIDAHLTTFFYSFVECTVTQFAGNSKIISDLPEDSQSGLSLRRQTNGPKS